MSINQDQFIINNFSYDLDDDEYYTLPNLKPCDFQGNDIKDEFANIDSIRKPLQSIAKELITKTQDLRITWKLNSNEQFNFKLPKSYFTKKVHITRDNSDKKIKKVENRYDFVPYVEFSNQQIQTIRKEGVFDVQSTSNPNLKYRWRLSRWLIKGTTNIKNSFYKDLSSAYDKIDNLGALLYDQKDFDSLCNFSFVHGFYLVCLKFIQIPSIFIGYREIAGHVDQQSVFNAIEAKRQTKIQKQFNLNLRIYNYLYDQEIKQMNNEKYHFLLDVLKNQEAINPLVTEYLSNQFLIFNGQLLNHSLEAKFKPLKKFNFQYDPKVDLQQQIQEKLHLCHSFQFEQNQFQVPQDVVNHLCNIVECYRLRDYYKRIREEEVKQFQEKLSERYEREYSYLKKIENHKKNFIIRRSKAFKQKLKKDQIQKLLQELKSKNITENLIYQEFKQNKQNYKQSQYYVRKSLERKNSTPNIKLIFKRYMLPTYQIIETNGEYEMIQIEWYTITSNHYFWKFSVFCVLYFCYVCNSFYFLYQYGIASEFGIKALLQMPPFFNKYEINKQTGEITPYNKVDTVYSNLQEVYRGMERSREEFEASEDTGIFGKGCLRICNLIEVYIFRFLFVGVFCILILKPFLILLNFCLYLFISLTSIMWVPMLLLLRWMFCIMIFDYDSMNRKKFDELNYINPILPLFVAMGEIFIGFIEMMVTLFFIILLPMLAALQCIYGMIKFFIRSLYDCLMMGFIHCCGRVPYRSGCLAWREGGDNIKQCITINYHKLSPQELIFLVAREIENAMLQEYETRITLKIDQPILVANQYLQPFFSYFNANYSFSEQESKKLTTQLQKTLQTRKNNFPQIDEQTKKNVRFTEIELIQIKEYIKNFLVQEFQNKNMHPYIWKITNIQIGDYIHITEKFLSNIFGSDILGPINQNEYKVEMKLKPENNLSKQIQKAMNGDINLNIPEQYELVSRQLPQKEVYQIVVYKKYIPWSEILELIWNAQSPQQQWCCINDKMKQFLINFQLIKK